MLYFLRQAVSVLILPGTVVLVIPTWITRRWNVPPEWPHSWLGLIAVTAGTLSAALGLVLFAASQQRFASDGRGTLAPWDPPRRLVVRGPYRYVRNPMISGVLFMLIGIALALRSWPHAVWVGVFAALNLTYIPLVEEPMLEARFHDDYRTYRKAVPRFFPLMRPWMGDSADDTPRRGR